MDGLLRHRGYSLTFECCGMLQRRMTGRAQIDRDVRAWYMGVFAAASPRLGKESPSGAVPESFDFHVLMSPCHGYVHWVAIVLVFHPD